jgi:radical SAM protein (TIGR01212 family)
LNPYYSFSSFLKEKFQTSVYKIVVDAGFSCPNRDGTRGLSGCTFCNNYAFSPILRQEHGSVTDQIQNGIERFKRSRKKGSKFLIYFQAYSNTYGDPDFLRKTYEKALEFSEVVGIAVGTRPDCLSPEVVKVISEMAEKTHFWLEIGLESSHNKTLERVNRGHTYEEFLEAYGRVRSIPDLYICLHLIHGLPGESREDMLTTVREVNRLKPDAVKFHQLEIVKDTAMESEYHEGRIQLLGTEEYMEILGESLQILHPEIVIQRLFGFTPSEYLIAPAVEKNVNYYQMINRYLIENQIQQGAGYEKVY